MDPRRDELMTVRQVLDELGGVSRRTFYRWRELGYRRPPSSSPTENSGFGGAISPPGCDSWRRLREVSRREGLGCP